METIFFIHTFHKHFLQIILQRGVETKMLDKERVDTVPSSVANGLLSGHGLDGLVDETEFLALFDRPVVVVEESMSLLGVAIDGHIRGILELGFQCIG